MVLMIPRSGRANHTADSSHDKSAPYQATVVFRVPHLWNGRAFTRSPTRAQPRSAIIVAPTAPAPARTPIRVSRSWMAPLPWYPRQVRDTTPEAARVQAEIYARMSGARRLLIACRMSDAVRSMARARIKLQHPDYDDRAVQDELIWELYGVRRPP